MSDQTALPDLLDLLHSAPQHLSTLKAEYRDWIKPMPSRSLLLEPVLAQDRLAGSARLRWRGAGPFPRASETRRTIWLQAPDCLRVEIRRDRRLARLGVNDGANWWRWDEAAGEDAGNSRMTNGHVWLPPLLDPPLLTPARLLGRLRFEQVETSRRLGRAVLSAHAEPRAGSPGARSQPRYELEFDAEYGIMLRLAAYDGPHCLQITEAIEIAYDQPLSSRLFAWPPADINLPVVSPAAPHPGYTPGTGRLLASAGGAVDRMTASTVWLTGLPGAGKTTLARALETELRPHSLHACVLDGDEIRTGLSSDLGLSRADRAEQARRVAHVAVLVAGTGAVSIVALVSPYDEDRRRARAIHDEAGVPFIEVWVNTPAQVCRARDPKGLSDEANPGRLTGMTRHDAPYETPDAPDVEVSGCDQPPPTAAKRIAHLLLAGGLN